MAEVGICTVSTAKPNQNQTKKQKDKISPKEHPVNPYSVPVAVDCRLVVQDAKTTVAVQQAVSFPRRWLDSSFLSLSLLHRYVFVRAVVRWDSRE